MDERLVAPTGEEMSTLSPEGCILLGWRGSVAHGVYLNPDDPSSVDDRDLMGIVIGPLECYFGLKEWGSRGTKEIRIGDWDVVHYEIRKMFSLLLQGNPNVVSLLWLQPDMYLIEKNYGSWMVQNRDIFSSKKMWNAFEGYAWSQHERMKRGEFKGHMSSKRQALFDKHGYDCKAAAHMIRLVRMAAEFYEEGRINVYREDSRELLDIKIGGWSVDKVQSEFELTIARASEACRRSYVKEEPDYEAANKLLKYILCNHFGKKVYNEWY